MKHSHQVKFHNKMATLGRLKHLENTFKILIMGDASVGKTSILTRYADSHFGKFCLSWVING